MTHDDPALHDPAQDPADPPVRHPPLWPRAKTGVQQMDFGLMFFSSGERSLLGDKYQFLLDAAKWADDNEFSSVWVPERHFSYFGCIYPNPVVLASALATTTRRVRLCSGSIVAPLHHPIRIFEDWAVVDNLSRGRIGLSFASGWNPDDFAFYPEKYPHRREEMYHAIEVVRRLWRGERVVVRNGAGKRVEQVVYPTPYQSELPLWLTAAKTPATFQRAGELGCNILTHLLDQDIPVLAEKIALYREARDRAGHDSATGYVTCMLHSYLTGDPEVAREQARAPYIEFLRSTQDLAKGQAHNRGYNLDFDKLSQRDVEGFLNFLYDRFVQDRAIIGSPQTAVERIGQLAAIGVDEIACLIDFGPGAELVLENLPRLAELRDLVCALPASAYPRAGTAPGAAEAPRTAAPPPGPAEPYALLAGDRDLPAIRRRCSAEMTAEDFYGRLAAAGVEPDRNGPRIVELWRRDGEALARLGTAAEPADPTDLPLPFLEPGSHTAWAALPDALESAAGTSAATYLPAGFLSLRTRTAEGKPHTPCWSHAVLRAEPVLDGEAVEADVRLLDEEGDEIAVIQRLRLERLAAEEDGEESVEDWLYSHAWEPREAAPPPPDQAVGRWLILTDRGGLGQRLAARLEAAGGSASLVPAAPFLDAAADDGFCPGAFHRLVQEEVSGPTGPVAGIVYLWALDTTPAEETTASSLMADQRLAMSAMVLLVQALAGTDGVGSAPVWAVTRGAHGLGVETRPLALAQAPLLGLFRTVSLEHPPFYGGLIDLDPEGDEEQAAAHIEGTLRARDGEDQVAFRRGKRHVFRILREDIADRQLLPVRTDASYLITGGLHGLGYSNARWLAERGARHLILLGRTPVPPRESWDALEPGSRTAGMVQRIQELEALGAHVHHPHVDLTDEEQVAALFQQLAERRQPPIRGVYHAASVWQHEGEGLVRPLAQTTVGSIGRVVPPKAVGAWLLQRHLADTELDFFMMYSAAGTLLGSAGQANYTGANSFLDALAQEMRRTGRPGFALNLGPVKEVGFGATPEGQKIHALWERRGIIRVTVEELAQALELLLPQPRAQIGLMRTDPERLARSYAGSVSQAALSRIIDLEAPGAGADLIPRLEAAAPEARHELLALELQRTVVQVMALDEAEAPELDQGLFELGLDSLLAMDLKNRIEAGLRTDFPATAIFDHPTLEALARYLLVEVLRMDVDEAAAPAAPAAVDLLEEIGSLSADEAEALLAQELAGAGEAAPSRPDAKG